MADDIRANVTFHGTVAFVGSFYPPDESITSDHFSSSATHRLATAKQIHRIDLHYQQADGTDVATDTQLMRICRGAGELLAVKVRPMTAPTGGDKQFTVDVKKAAEASGTFASMLNAVVTVDNTAVDDTVIDATLAATPTTAAEDVIEVVVTASGSTGSQGQGLIVSLYYEEDPS